MRILSCLLILCIFLSASCSKPINPAEKFYNKGRLAYSKKNYKEAFKYYKKIAELGNAKAMYELGNMYYLGDGVLWKDPKKAKYWIKKAYEAGNKDAEKAWNSLALWSARP